MSTNSSFHPLLGKIPNYRIEEEDVEADEPEERSGSSSLGSDESSTEVQDSDDDTSETDEESYQGEESGEDEAERCNDVLDEEEPDDDRVCDGEMPRKRVKTKNWVPDEAARWFDAPISSSQQTIKQEPDSVGQTCNDQVNPNEESESPKFARIQTEVTSFDCYDFNDLIGNNQNRMKPESADHSSMVVLDQTDHHVELPLESNNSTNLKLVYDVEYQAPD